MNRTNRMATVIGAVVTLFFPFLALSTASMARNGDDAVEPDSVTTTYLEELLVEAERNRPLVLAAHAQTEADLERPSQVGSLPDPVVGIAASNLRIDSFTLDSTPMAGVDFRLKQGFPFPGKLGRRRKLAEAEVEISEQIAHKIATDIRAQVKSRYWHLSGVEAIAEITRNNLAVLEKLIDVANSRFAVGMGSQQDVLQAQAALSELAAQLLQREQETRNAQRELNVAVGRRADAAPIQTSTYALTDSELIEADLIKMASHLNPELRVQAARVTRAEKSLDVASYDRWPDLAVGGGYRMRQAIDDGVSDGGDLVFVSFELSIPLYASTKQNKRVAESKARLLSERYTDMELRLQVESITRNLIDESNRVLEQAKLFRDEVIPQDQFALDASVSDYSVGRIEFDTIINNWQALLRDEIALERLTATLGVRRAELEFVVGRNIQ